MDPEHGTCDPTMCANSHPVFVKQNDQFARGISGLFSRFRHASQEEFHPCFPTSGKPYFLEQTVIIIPAALEEQTEIQDWLTQHASLAQHQRDQQAS